MEKNNIIYMAFLAALLQLCSCTQEAPQGSGLPGDGHKIFFRSHLPAVDLTRAGVVTDDDLMDCRVTCFIPDDDQYIDSQSGAMSPYFHNSNFVKDAEGNFNAEEGNSCNWPSTQNRLHFFAHWPAAEALQETAADTTKYKLANYSSSSDGKPNVDYRLEKFMVAREISNHIDFITAYSYGTQQENGTSGINLDFKHRLARVELSAWSESTLYDVEIAGVRIGNAITEGDFSFSSLMTASGEAYAWLNTAGKRSVVDHIFAAGESVVTLAGKGESYSDKSGAASIMGAGIPAMVIPMGERIEAWQGLGDPNIGALGYTTDRLYFSVLLRVESPKEGLIYPYPDGAYGLPVVYLVVGADGKVKRRVYRIGGSFYTGEQQSEDLLFVADETEEIRGYCWASVPVAAKWEAGKIYAYKLDYSDGVGLHDPSYPSPGTPIISSTVKISVEVSDWKEGSKTEVTVPRK